MILVDGVAQYETKLRHKSWSHMVSTLGVLELHDMAARLGLKRSWFQSGDGPKTSFDHYDITPPKRERAIKLGAIEVSSRALLFANYDYGRRRKVRPCEACAATGSTAGQHQPTCPRCDLCQYLPDEIVAEIFHERRLAILR